MERINENFGEQPDNGNLDERLKNGVMKKYSEKETPIEDGGIRNTKRVELSFQIPDAKTIIIARCEIADKLKFGDGKEKAIKPRIEFDSVRELEFGEGKGAKILPPYIASHLFEFAQGASPERLQKELARLREMYVFGCDQDAKTYEARGGEEKWFLEKTEEVLKDQGIQAGKITIAPSLAPERSAEVEKILRLGRLVALKTLNVDFFSLYDAPDGEFKAVQFAHALVSRNGPKATDLWREYLDRKEKAGDKRPGNLPMAAA